MKRWSKLQMALYRIIDPKLKFEIHCNAYRIGDSTSDPFPRFWVIVGNTIMWDYPKDFMNDKGDWNIYLAAEKFSCLIREYIDCPADELLTHDFDDYFKLVPLLQVCDKRIGKRRLETFIENEKYAKYKDIIWSRINDTPANRGFELSNFGPKYTNVPVMIWTYSKMNSKYGIESPRIEFSNTEGARSKDAVELIPVSISDSPQILKNKRINVSKDTLRKVFEWVRLNKTLLLDMWNCEICSMTFARNMQKINDNN